MFPVQHSFEGAHKNGSLWARQGRLDQAPQQLCESVNDNVTDEHPAQVQADHLAEDEHKEGEPGKE